MWLALIKQYWNVSVFKEEPKNTPYSLLLACIVSLVFFVLVVLQWMITDINQQLSIGSALLIAGLLVLSYLVYTWILLAIFRLQPRTIQTLTCLLAGHTVVHVVAFPMLLIMPLLFNVKNAPLIGSFVGIFYLIFTLMLAIWQFMVSVYVYKHALSATYLSATLAGFGLLAFNILTISFWR